MSASATEITPMRIGDRLVVPPEADTSVVRSPYDGHEVGRVPAGGVVEIDAAVADALERHRSGAMPAYQRAEILDAAARQLATQNERFARLIADESAKPITTARVEAARAVDTFRFAAAAARTLTGETVPIDASVAGAGAGKLAFVLRMPIGVVGAISPFNFPLNLVAHKVAPAIAAGCPVVLKPASATPLTALALAELLIVECGLPSGWLNVVTCSGEVADRLVTHPDIAMITFTGSPDVGWSIRSRAPRKKVGLELGNNAPVIIEADADLRATAKKISTAGFSFAGQSCISVQRVYVHRSVIDEFLNELVPLVQALRVGDPLDDATDVSALISTKEKGRVSAAVAHAVDEGARVACGGAENEHGLLMPTVLTDVLPDMDVCRTEIFGPVVGVAAYDTFDEAIDLANDTRYGLQAALFTADLGRALEGARRLEFGGVLVNEVPTWRADHMPYGGVRDSGNTREGPMYAAHEMTEPRLVVLQP